MNRREIEREEGAETETEKYKKEERYLLEEKQKAVKKYVEMLQMGFMLIYT